MIEFILEIIFFLSVSGALVMASRAVERVDDDDVKGDFNLEKWIESLPLQHIDSFLRSSAHKALRRLRLTILKIDNSIGSYLEKTKETNGGGNGVKVQDLFSRGPIEKKINKRG